MLTAYFLTLALLFAASFLTEHRWWGLSWWGYLPVWLRILAFAAAALLPWFLGRRLIAKENTSRPKSGPWAMSAAIVLVSSGVFLVLLRTRMHLLGDGFQLLSRLAHDAPPIRPWNPAVYFLQDNLYALLGAGGEANALIVFRIISWAAGLLFVGGLLWAAKRIAVAYWERLLVVLAIAAGGQALLFFGYVENYPMFATLIGLFVLFGWLAMSGHLNRWWTVVPLIPAAFFHPFTAAILPALIYLLICYTAPVRWYDRRSTAERIGLWAAVIAPVVVVLYWLQSDISFLRFALVPWVADRFTVEGYTLLSAKHLADWVNLTFMFAPPLLMYLVAWTGHGEWSDTERHTHRFLLLATVPALAVAFLFDPKLGMARDWDIFAFGAIPLTIFGVSLLLKTSRPERTVSLILAVVLSLMVLAPRLAVEASEPKAVAMFLNLADLDRTKNRGGLFVLLRYYQEAGRNDEFDRLQKVFAARYPQDTLSITGQELFAAGKLDEAEAVFRETVRLDPTYASAWANLGVIMGRRKQSDSAETFLRIADGLNPYNPDTYNNLGGTYFELRRYDEAERMWKKSWALNQETFIPLRFLLMLYAKEQRRDDYLALMTEAAVLPKAPAGLVKEYADYLITGRRFAEASAQYRRALAAGLDSSLVRAVQEHHPEIRIIP